MKKIFAILFLLGSIQMAGYAQKPSVEWVSTWGSIQYSLDYLVFDEDGNLLRTRKSGGTPTMPGHVFLEKFDAATGQRLMGKVVGGGDGNERCSHIIKAYTGGFILAGSVSSTNLPGITLRGASDGWLVKLNEQLEIEWQKNYGGSGEEEIKRIKALKEGGYVIVGYTTSEDGDWSLSDARGGHDLFVMKLDNDGTILWNKRYGGSGRDAYHITSEYNLDVLEDTINGGFVIVTETGSSDGDIIFGGNTRKAEEVLLFTTSDYYATNQTQDSWILKLDGEGDLQWSRCYGGTKNQWGVAVQMNTAGEYLIGMVTLSNDGDISYAKGGVKSDYWLAWLDKDGTLLRDKSYGGEGTDMLYQIIQSSEGGFLLVGESESRTMDVDDNIQPVNTSFYEPSPWLVKIAESGDIEWTRHLYLEDISSNDACWAIQDPSGAYYVTSEKWIARLGTCPSVRIQEAYICAGESYDFHGRVLTEAGIYYDTLGVSSDCPNYIQLTLHVRSMPFQPQIVVQGNVLTTTEPFATYQWYQGDTPLSWGKSSILLAEQSDGYKLMVVDQGGCESELTDAYTFIYNGCEAPAIEWERSYGGSKTDEANSVAATSDGGYLLVGLTNSLDGDVSNLHGTNNDLWLIKINAQGDTTWTTTWGGSGADIGYAVRTTSDGGFVVAGQSQYNASAGNNTATRPVANGGGIDVWVLKFSAQNVLEWQYLYGGQGNDMAYNIEEVSGGYVVVGVVANNSTSGTLTGIASNGGNDGWILKLNTDGTLQWQRRLGGGGNDFLHSVCTSPDGGYVAVGYSNITAANYKNKGTLGDTPRPVAATIGDDIWVIKLDMYGNTVWQKLYGGSKADRAYAIKNTVDGGYVLAGYSDESNTPGTLDDATAKGGNDFVLMKLDASGNKQWTKLYGGSALDQANSYNLLADSDGYLFAGHSASLDQDVTGSKGNSDFWIVKTDLEGNIQWQKTLGGSGADYPTALVQADDGGYAVAGYTNSPERTDLKGGNDFYFIKLKGCRTCTEQTAESTCEGQPFLFGEKTITASGYYYDTLWVDGCEKITVLDMTVTPLPAPVVTMQQDTLRTGIFASYQWLKEGEILAGATDSFYPVTESGNYSVLVSNGTCTETSELYYASITTSLSWSDTDKLVKVFPNPVESAFVVQFSKASEYEVLLLGMDGRVLLEREVSGIQATFDIPYLTQGIYILKVREKAATGYHILRIVKQ